MMKRLAVVLALVVPVLASANISPGTIELGGDTNLGFRSGSEKIDVGPGGTQTTDTTDYGLSTSGFYYLTPNVGVGAVLDYTNSSRKLNGITNGTSTFLLGPAVAVETEVAPKLAVFGRAFVGYASSTFTQTGTPDVSASGIGLGIEGGVKYFLVKNLSFDAGLVYDWTKLSGDAVLGVTPKSTISSFGVIAGVSVYFGGAGH